MLIIDRVDQLLIRCRRNNTTGVALFVDLDNFKNVNDTFGHDVGDQLLRMVAIRMSGTLHAADTIGRMGGDEFVVLADVETTSAPPTTIAERLLTALDEPFTLHLDDGPFTLHVSASIGIAVGDRASAGSCCATLTSPCIERRPTAATGTAASNRRCRPRSANASGSRSTCATRWPTTNSSCTTNRSTPSTTSPSRAPKRCCVGTTPPTASSNPTAFVPILEQTGQIVEVGRWVLAQACHQVAGWRRAGSPLTVAINVSAGQLDHRAIVDHVREALRSSKLEPDAITLEVTETALMSDPVAIAERLHAIKQLGVRIAVDDFGTGYSSLAYLQRFPVDSLKIDRSFIAGIARSTQADALLRTLVRLGRDLGLTTLAEGVETIEQLDQLRDESVNQVQGYLLARPLPADAFESTILPTPTTDSRDQR